MANRPLFPLFFVSGLLLAYYQRALKAHRADRGALGLLLKSWWQGPRALPVAGLQRAGGHSYSLSLDEDFCSDEMGHTTLMLLEDGRPLPLAHSNSVKKIASQGLGRWVHVGRKIFFSPSDNADLGQTAHQYHLIDGLGSRPEIFGALSKLAQLKSSFRNPAAYALAKLQLVLGSRLTLASSREPDDRRLDVRDIRLDLAAAGLPTLVVESLAIQLAEMPGAWRIEATLGGITFGDWALDSLVLDLDITPACQISLVGLEARHQDQTLLSWQGGRPDEGGAAGRLLVHALAPLREALAQTCGGPDGARRWLVGFLADLDENRLELGLRAEGNALATLMGALLGEACPGWLELVFRQTEHGMRFEARTDSPVATDTSAPPEPPRPAPTVPSGAGAGLPDGWTAQLGKPLEPEFAGRVASILDPARPALVVRGIPRFVESDRYAGSFSFQWTTYTDTQLDSQQGVALTEQDLRLKTGFTPEEVAGKLVLDAGVGTGRHAEVMAAWGARVVGVDLSEAVETARDNLARFPNALVMQADIGALPFQPASFDIIYSIGVLHHTPDTRAYTERLIPLLKPGGILAIWVYPPKFQRRAEWVPLVSRLPAQAFQAWCEWIIDLARPHRDRPWVEAFIRQFPFATHHPTPQRSVLALFDGYTPTFHWTHGQEEVSHWFRQWGLEEIRTVEEPTAVRGRKPGLGQADEAAV